MVPLIEKSCDTLVVKLGEIADSGELNSLLPPSLQCRQAIRGLLHPFLARAVLIRERVFEKR